MHNNINKLLLLSILGLVTLTSSSCGFLMKTTAGIKDLEEAPGGGAGSQNNTAGALGYHLVQLSTDLGNPSCSTSRALPTTNRGFDLCLNGAAAFQPRKCASVDPVRKASSHPSMEPQLFSRGNTI